MVVYDLHEEYTIKKLCNYLKISTSGYYRWLKIGRPIRYSFDEWLADEIEKIFYQTYKGYRLIMSMRNSPKMLLKFLPVLLIRFVL